MDDAEAIKRKKLEELQRRQAEAASPQQSAADYEARQAQELQKQAVLRALLLPEARERLVRVKMARPEFGAQVENLSCSLPSRAGYSRRCLRRRSCALLRQYRARRRTLKYSDYDVIEEDVQR